LRTANCGRLVADGQSGHAQCDDRKVDALSKSQAQKNQLDGWLICWLREPNLFGHAQCDDRKVGAFSKQQTQKNQLDGWL